MRENDGNLLIILAQVKQSSGDHDFATGRDLYVRVAIFDKDDLPVEPTKMARVWLLRLSPPPALLGDAENGGVVGVIDAEATVGGVDDSLGDATDTGAPRVAWVEDHEAGLVLSENEVREVALFLMGVED